ncbi:uroporphyrinogen decarboxylase [Tistlia consotensis]|uniref:Uroporphyrinogen decarboxylase n=1 Tax=Tistlia consotensis USBA 355 TaxID=560819 RepID=A0A1Y6BFX3_9PROT|nr:uroporphyrinogen decarboxylase [Tistlia consotensis]SMF08975.1 uroporphyrinogen decarboxylase [Tistlia consotensis USBA 355]SNR34958.1 uroporphyrinogen decarboxylase [Tistlia consotensis]
MVPGQSADKRFLRALGGEAVWPPPVWLMRQAGRYLPEYRKTRAEAGDFLDLCLTPELAVEVTLQPIRRFGFDAAILFSDILVVPHGLGQKVWFEEGTGPRLEPLDSPAAIGRLEPSALRERLAPVFETLRRLRSSLPAETALIGFAGAPWTVASYMIEGGSSRDFQKGRSWAYGDPAGFQGLIDLLVEATSDYLLAQVEAGAEAVQLFDSWAGVWPDDQFRRWCLEPATRIVATLKRSHPDLPVILFPRGAGALYRDVAERAGADALSLDTTVPLDWARAELQSRVCVQGNLDPVALIVGEPALERQAGRILEAFRGGPFVFNLGHGIDKSTPPAHVERLMTLLRGA